MPAPAITDFHGPNRFLSNHWLVQIPYDNWTFDSVEHAYCSMKTHDPVERDRVNYFRSVTVFEGAESHNCRPTTPGEAKRAGRKVTLRGDWAQVQLGIMEDLLRIKFEDLWLRKKLLGTADAELVEGNQHGDWFWGSCGDPRDANNLGKLLMKIRAELQADEL